MSSLGANFAISTTFDMDSFSLSSSISEEETKACRLPINALIPNVLSFDSSISSIFCSLHDIDFPEPLAKTTSQSVAPLERVF